MTSSLNHALLFSLIASSAFFAFDLNSAMPVDSAATCGISSDAFGLTKNKCGAISADDRASWSGLHIDEGTQVSSWKSAGPVANIEVFAGEKSVRAGGDIYMSAALLFDNNGNPASDGTPTHFTGNSIATTAPLLGNSLGGVASAEYHSPNKTGFAMLAVEANSIESRREMVQIIPARSAGFELTSATQRTPASMETVTRINSNPIKDIYGNAIADGMYVALRGNDANARTDLYGTVTSNAIASSDILTREVAALIGVHAVLDDVITPKLSLLTEQFKMRDELGFSMRYEIQTHSLIVNIGPLATSGGYLLPDGVGAKLNITSGANSISSTQQINDGFIHTRFALGQAKTVEIGLEVGNSQFFGHFESKSSSHSQILLEEIH